MLFCLCVSLTVWIPPSLSLTHSHSLFILGFTVSIPEGRSIDCNSLSMKSPLCCWRKETSFNRTITLFLCSFWSLPLFPSIYTISLTLCFVLGARRLLGRQYRQRSEATAGGLLDDQWRRIRKNHHTTVLYLWVMQKRWADGQRRGQCGKIEEISNSCQIEQGTVNITSLRMTQPQAWHSYNMHVTRLYVHVCACMGDKHTEKLMNRLVIKTFVGTV